LKNQSQSDPMKKDDITAFKKISNENIKLKVIARPSREFIQKGTRVNHLNCRATAVV
jgi:hypothetical protein